ncbi:MAG: SMP-30/gluconolactonase/LRE family protein [Puniceicoccaceae bacterium]
MNKASVRSVGKRVSRWGEGPIWWEGALYFVDILGHELVRFNPETGEEAAWDLGEPVGTVVPTDGEEVIYAGAAGCFRFDPISGQKTLLAGNPESANRFNDGKCDPLGRLWVGTISAPRQPDAALYCLDGRRGLQKRLTGITNSNGIGWSIDGKTMYYIDTPTRKVQAFPYALSEGVLGEPEVCVDTVSAGIDGSPDGMAIDNEGMLWVAFCHGGCVAQFDPETGRTMRKISFPTVETTACAFGGPELDRLYVTTGIKADLVEPEAGRLFVVEGLGVKGLPAQPFRG